MVIRDTVHTANNVHNIMDDRAKEMDRKHPCLMYGPFEAICFDVPPLYSSLNLRYFCKLKVLPNGHMRVLGL